MTQTPLEAVDLSSYQFAPDCEQGCGHPATVIAQGCMDRQPVLMCDDCLHRGLELVNMVVRMYQKLNKRVMICGDCHRPILSLDTHLDVRKLA